MAKKKTVKLSTFGMVFMAVAALGLIAAIVGLFVPWFARTSSSFLGNSSTTNYGLFDEFLMEAETDFPFGLVTTFGIISAVVALIGAGVTVAKGLGFVELGFIAKVVAVAVIVVVGVLTLVFAFVYVGNAVNIDLGDIGGSSFGTSAGAYLSGIGAILTGAALFFE